MGFSVQAGEASGCAGVGNGGRCVVGERVVVGGKQEEWFLDDFFREDGGCGLRGVGAGEEAVGDVVRGGGWGCCCHGGGGGGVLKVGGVVFAMVGGRLWILTWVDMLVLFVMNRACQEQRFLAPLLVASILCLP